MNDIDGNSEYKHCKVFVGGLSIFTTDDGFRNFFSEFGTIVDSIIIRETKTNKSKGFGFVTFDNSESVDKVLDARPMKIDEREVDVKRAIPKEDNNPSAHIKTNKIFMGGLASDMTKEEVKDYFEKHYGAIKEVEMVTDRESMKFRGFAFITFESADDTDKAVITSVHDIRGTGKNSRVRKAEDRNSASWRAAFKGNEMTKGFFRGDYSGPQGYYDYSQAYGGNEDYNYKSYTNPGGYEYPNYGSSNSHSDYHQHSGSTSSSHKHSSSHSRSGDRNRYKPY